MKMTVIPAIPKFSIGAEILTVRKRVAAYARVSTDSKEQLTSYAAQVDYYTKLIQNNDEWEFVGIYTDEGISATNTKHRDGFNKMIEDTLSGKIDLILTKSVSRFARNTVDTLTTVRKLKEKGVEVYFEKENIYTLDSKGELLITIMSSLAQEESRSISENVTWGQRKRFSDGKISLPYKSFLGYEKGEDNLPKIVEKEAKIVRMMYRMYLEGKTPTYIANHLTKLNIPTPGNKTKWQASTVTSILTNEKYKGDAILQKYFTVDFLSKKRKLNEGEVQQYYIEDSHPAIISPEVFDLVQIEFQKRKGKRTSTAGIFASKLICGECNGYYGSKIWHSNSKYRRTIWQCNQKFKNKQKCKTPHFTDELLKKHFVDMFNSTIKNRDEIISTIEDMIISLTNTDKLDEEIQNLQKDLETAATDIQLWVNQNTVTQSDQNVYEKEYKKRVDIYKKISAKIEEKEQEKVLQINKQKEAINILHIMENNKTAITEFDEGLFQSLIEHIVVKSNKLLVFIFKDGSEVEWEV